MDQKIILITGATTGIGRNAALHLAKKGHRVIATGRNVQALASLKEAASGTELETLRVDVTDAQSIALAKEAVDRMTSGYGIDVLVNNAGFGSAAPIVESPDSEVRSQYETNVFGLLAMVRAFVPAMMDRRSGRIVNVSSIGGRITMPLFGAYNSTKYAVESLSDAMRYELAPFGVKVSLIEPGPIKTEFSNTSVSGVSQYQTANSRYAQVFAKADQLKQKADAMSADPIVVTRAIEKAATSARPSIRYVMPFSSAIGVFFGKLMPTAILDFVFRLATGLTPKMLAGTPARPSVRPPRLLPASQVEARA
jgi:short-subunit dehydrogenase